MTTLESRARRFPSRIGICALNLLLPGLGLVRLARNRLAALFVALQLASAALVAGGYGLIRQMPFGEWAALIGAAIVLALAAYLGSIIASWRASRTIEPRSGRAWRWYGVLAIWLVWVIVSWPAAHIARSGYHAFYIPSVSMLPTMQINDRYLADMHDGGPISRGDLVIVRLGGVDYVKRVAALPGDTIALSGGTVILNGKPITQQVVEKTRMKDDGYVVAATVSREQFPGEAKPHFVMDTGPGWLDDFAEVTLPPDRYFVLGDNRDHSMDSRLPPDADGGLGLVPRAEITGRIAFRYWRSGSGLGPGRD